MKFSKSSSFLLFSSVILLSIAPLCAQKIRLRSIITPDCGVTSTLKFADIYADGNIAVMGGYACKGAFIFDISDPDHPKLASWYDPTPNQTFLEAIVIGNRGYFGSGGPTPSGSPGSGEGVHIVDLSDPYHPALLGKVNSSIGNGFNGLHEMVVFDQNGQRYLIENYNSFATKLIKVINVTDPASPVFVRDIDPTEVSWVHAVHIRGNRMFTSGWGTSSARGRTEIYDISNIQTQAPQLLGYVEDPNSSVTSGNNMHSSWTSEDGKYLYSAREVTNSNGPNPGDVRTYDISDPAVPVLVNRVSMSDLGLNAITPHNPVVSGGKLYVSWYQAGLQVFDISAPSQPKRLGQYDTYEQTFLPRPNSKKVVDESWDIICGRDNLQNTLPTSYNGAWAVFPFLGEDRVLIGDLNAGLLIVDVSGTNSAARNGNSDFDGDRKTDLSVYTPGSGTWYFENTSSGNLEARPWGLPDDQPTPGDYDGDGKADVAVFRPSDGYWYVKTAAGEIQFISWGQDGDIPVPADYDSDGKTDAAVFRPSTGYWYIRQSTLGVKFVSWGQAGDKPLAGDYDGDGKADLAVFRPSSGYWYVIQSSSSVPVFVSFGAAEDKPLAGDFTGDGRSDYAVYRPSTGYWYVLDASGQSIIYFSWGLPTDTPVPADYDGDGKADFAVYRPNESVWYIVNSSTGGFNFRQFGQVGDKPSPAASNPQ